MYPLLAALTQFLVVALVATATVLGVAVGYFFVRARRAEEAHALSSSERAELKRRDAEIAAIRKRIEEMYRYQRHGSETQHALVGQQIEQMQHELQARSRQIEGLQSQLRHEMQQREASMQELRQQLGEALRTFSRPALPAPPPSPAAALPAPAPAPPAADAPAPGPAAGWTWEPVELDFSLEPPPTPAQPPPPPQANDFLSLFDTPPPEEAPPAFTPIEDLLADDTPPLAEEEGPGELDGLIRWASLNEDLDETQAYPMPSPEAEAARTEAAASDGLAQENLGGFTFEEPLFFSGDGHGGDGQGRGGDGLDAQRATPPDDAEDLTVLPMVTEARQARLYALGVYTVEEIARWNRVDARRMAAALGDQERVSEDMIMNEWVFAAQALLFDRYQAELQARRPGVR